MADLEIAFQKTMRNEGGYRLHEVDGDRGGMTYAGIARKFHPSWSGWGIIDRGDMDNPELTGLVRLFYRVNFWNKISGSEIKSQIKADSIYDFAVNAGHKTAIKLAQLAVGSVPDGVIGPKTLKAIEDIDEDAFVAQYAIAKISRYAAICNKNKSQKKFLLGWINRTMKGLSNG